ncbi:hypothetical protein [Staphylococcus capitis]|uniref:hypothetical protein n=1 Tax=Staphylococcus capitis TaxID=29388 RepID=UPI002DBDB9C5|nr:hypothetical protein [Staphylococcus capitis]MEB5628443.1 hypothetical protein [Staphylococcus capitis]
MTEHNSKEYYQLQSGECCKRMKERYELINDMKEIKRKAFDEIKEAADTEKLNGFVLYDNDSFIDKLNCVFNEMEANHER